MKIASTCLYVAIGTAMAFGASAQPHRVHNPDIHNVVPVPSEPAGCATEGTLAAGGPASAGDTCGAASAIANYNTATCDAIIDGYPGPEEVWELEVPGTIAADIVLTPAAADMAIALVSSCGVGTSCIGFRDTIGNGAASGLNVGGPGDAAFTVVDPANVPAGTYYVYVDSYYAAGANSCGAYSLAVTGTVPVELMEFSIN